MTDPKIQRALDAIEARDAEALRTALEDHPDLASTRHPGHRGSLLHDAAYADDVDLCRILVEAGCPTDWIREADATPDHPHSGPGSQTALALALENGKRNAAAYLAGVDVAPDNLWVAASLGNGDRVRALVDEDGSLRDGARDPNKAGDDTFVLTDAMVGAAHQRHHDLVELLLDRGADVSGRDQFGMTALHYAVQGNRALTELLLDRGADVRVRDFQFNATPYGWARYLEHADMAELLESRCELDPGDRS